jgi:hypothetical protein
MTMILDQQQMIKALWKNVVAENDIKNNRERYNVIWRHAFAVAVTEATALSYQVIGKIIDKDHTTVVHCRKIHNQNYDWDPNYKQVYIMMLDQVQDLMDKYQQQITEVIKKRKIPVSGGRTIDSLIDMYERKLNLLDKKYKTQLADYQGKCSKLEKALRIQTERAENLNKEALRLKNLL